MEEISYKSFCWCLGTTSFRTKNFNKTIETQLGLLDSFWKLPENIDQEWLGNDVVQGRYYDYMKKNDFLSGDAPNKQKDAREKTSGLVDLGLIYENRRLSETGTALLNMSQQNDFADKNFFGIPKDSLLFTKQLLKTSCDIDGNTIRPFIILIYALSELQYLTFDEFKYLLPLCTSEETTRNIIENIRTFRQHRTTIEDIIFDRLISMDNYKAALDYFLEQDVSEEIVCIVGINRKSRQYDKAYYPLYKALKAVYLDGHTNKIPNLLEAVNGLSSGVKTIWKKQLFSVSQTRAILNRPTGALNHTDFDGITTEEELKNIFFRIMQVNKAKATLSDYFDLNRRYFKTSDLVLFQEDRVELDIVPKHFFVAVADCLYQEAFVQNEKLFENIELEEISPCLVLNKEDILKRINNNFGTHARNLDEANEIIEQEKYKRLQHLIDTKFTDEALQILLDKFQDREDEAIQDMVTDNADVPTIFEYVLGIIWYKISGTGKILDYMKLSLDSDLLPKTHAAGGEADIVYEYAETEYYPKHALLLEATLADKTNQRRMEMEPVSRHLGQHLIRTKNNNSYCVFATNYLDVNVVADFRSRKHMRYYDPQCPDNSVKSMKIMPLSTDNIKSILMKGLKYKDLYAIFDAAYKDEEYEEPLQWRKHMLEAKL